MIGYTTLGTDDLERSAAFYDALFEALGGKRAITAQDFLAWSFGLEQAMFSVHLPFNGKTASVGNGVMIALRVGNPNQVALLHELALSLGARDEGAPGARNNDGFFAAYFRDLDGNKLNVHCMNGSEQ